MSIKKPAGDSPDKVTTMRVRQSTLKIFNLASTWKNITLLDYLEYLAQTVGMRDLREAQKGIEELGKGGK